MKLAAWARANGVHPHTAYRWFRQGPMPVAVRRLPSGAILVEVPGGTEEQRMVRYARVSARDQRTDLDRQVATLSTSEAGQGVVVAGVVGGVGFGVSGPRPRLRRLFADPTVGMVVVEQRGRRARFGGGRG